MKLSDLLKIDEIQAQTDERLARGVYGLSVYGVDVDVAEDLTPPGWLKEIGLVLKMDDEGQINEDVLDVAISYRLAKVKVLMEVPFDKDQPANEGYLLSSIATNMQVALSFLPPESNDEADFEAYVLHMRAVTKAFLEKPNLDQMVMPVTNYIEYLFSHLIVPDRPFQVKDAYVISAYAQVLTPERVDVLKEAIREEVYNHFGGKEGFEDAAKVILTKVYDETVMIATKTAEYLKNRKKEEL